MDNNEFNKKNNLPVKRDSEESGKPVKKADPADKSGVRIRSSAAPEKKPSNTNTSGQTAVFDKYKSEAELNEILKKSYNSEDPTYNLKSGQIQSGRQKFADPISDKPVTPPRKKSGKSAAAENNSVLSSVLKIVIYIFSILTISIVLGYNVVLIGNDVFSFVKAPLFAEVVIPEGATVGDVAEILYDKGLIKYKNVFKFYASFRKRDTNFLSGTYYLSTDMNYDEFLYEIREKSATAEVVTITIPEGYTIDEIVNLFLSSNIGTKEGFEDAINNYDRFAYKFINEIPPSRMTENRKYRLEGYLFPDTYFFYANSSEITVLNKLLFAFNEKFSIEFYNRCEKLNMSVDDIITIASIIEREAKMPEDYTLVSSVIHNRLNSPKYPNLECDSTLQYSLPEHNPDLTGEDMKLDVPYNTYLYPGLPPSAICNPGYEAIYAALYPEITDYYFFVSTNSGTMLFGRTLEEHNKNINIARSETGS